MGDSSAAEAKLEAALRPEISVMRARTSYPRRHRPVLTALPGGAARPAEDEAAGAPRAGRAGVPLDMPGPGADGSGAQDQGAWPGTGTARIVRSSASFAAARTIRTASSAGFRAQARPAAGQARGRGAVSQTRVIRPAWPVTGGGAAGRTARPAGQASRGGDGLSRQARVPAPVRLTRRGRIVVSVLAGLAVVSAAALIWLAVTGQAQAASKAARVPAGGQGMVKVVVRPGQTLWAIAEKADPLADPRLVIQQIVDDNALSGTSVRAGQVLWVPRG
ncbi:MAG TPA: LysM peptidoglycan-binding domain-containing protein [Streptosporangiaceae bacterium]